MASRPSSAATGRTPAIRSEPGWFVPAASPALGDPEPARWDARMRLTVGSLTLWCRAACAAVRRPDNTSSTTAARCSADSFGRRPALRP